VDLVRLDLQIFPPGVYSISFSIEGFTELRQEDVRISTGSQVQLDISLRPSLAEEFTVVGQTPQVDSKKTGTSDTFSRGTSSLSRRFLFFSLL
jgi:hypothetical protein